MHDVEILLDDRPGSLAELGEALGNAGLSIEGGGAFVSDGRGVGHFLFEDGHVASRVLEAAGLRVNNVREVVALKLRQGEPGQLGKLCRRMAMAGVNIVVQYSDHANRLILVVDDLESAARVASEWIHSG
jgi:hypothetical protein